MTARSSSRTSRKTHCISESCPIEASIRTAENVLGKLFPGASARVAERQRAHANGPVPPEAGAEKTTAPRPRPKCWPGIGSPSGRLSISPGRHSGLVFSRYPLARTSNPHQNRRAALRLEATLLAARFAVVDAFRIVRLSDSRPSAAVEGMVLPTAQAARSRNAVSAHSRASVRANTHP